MTLHFRENQYQGVNAHLQSSYQAKGGWSGFHSKHISDLAEHIDSQLPAGYEVDIEQSLQIREFHPDSGERVRNPRPDISIYSQTDITTVTPSDSPYALATLTQSIADTVPTTEELHYVALRIYRVDDEIDRQAIIHLEVLSPTNKGQGNGTLQYIEKRVATLKSGLRLIEIDYLHETRSPIRGIPHYPTETDSFPYYIHIGDPFPTFDEGIAATYGFYVDDPIPQITVPLMKQDMLTIDFQTVYDLTFKSLSAFSRRVDYAIKPDRFDTYSASDQHRIISRLQAVQAQSP